MVKTCTKCGEEKGLKEFGKSSKTKDGRRYRCKACRMIERQEPKQKEQMRQYKQAYYSMHKGEISEAHKEWYSKNKEKVAVKGKKYYQTNKEKIKAAVSKWQKENKDKVNTNSKRYKANHPERVKERGRLYNLRCRPAISEYQRKHRIENPRQYEISNKRNNIKRTSDIRNRPCKMLHDSYIRGALSVGTVLCSADISQELIKLKRIQLKITRFLKKGKKDECKEHERVAV